jgi:hypothetical protein
MLKCEKRDKGGNEKRRETKSCSGRGNARGERAVSWFIITPADSIVLERAEVLSLTLLTRTGVSKFQSNMKSGGCPCSWQANCRQLGSASTIKGVKKDPLLAEIHLHESLTNGGLTPVLSCRRQSSLQVGFKVHIELHIAPCIIPLVQGSYATKVSYSSIDRLYQGAEQPMIHFRAVRVTCALVRC